MQDICWNLKAIDAIASMDGHLGWNGATQDRKYAKESLAKKQHLPEAIKTSAFQACQKWT